MNHIDDIATKDCPLAAVTDVHGAPVTILDVCFSARQDEPTRGSCRGLALSIHETELLHRMVAEWDSDSPTPRRRLLLPPQKHESLDKQSSLAATTLDGLDSDSDTPTVHVASRLDAWRPLSRATSEAGSRIAVARARSFKAMPVALASTGAPTSDGPRLLVRSSVRVVGVVYDLSSAIYASQMPVAHPLAMACGDTEAGCAGCCPALLVRFMVPIWDGRALYEYCASLLRFVDGILSALRLALVRLRSALTRQAETPTFLSILLATARRYGRRDEPAPWALPRLTLHPSLRWGAVCPVAYS